MPDDDRLDPRFRRILQHLHDSGVRMVVVDDLIAMKRVAGRPKDERHLMELAALKRVMAEEAEGGV